MAANSFLRMLFGQGTEPSYGGLRVPRQRVEDDSQFIRIGNPQERFRDYHDDRSGYNTVDTSQIDEMSRVEGGNRLVQSEEDKAKAKKKMQGLISGIGGDLAQMFAQHQEPTKPLQFAQLQQQQMIPLIDPRFMRYGGGRKRGGRVEPGTFVDVHDDEKVVNTGDDVIVVPKKEVKTLEAMLGNKVLPREPEAIPSFEQFQESRKTAEQPITFPEEVTATEQVTPTSVTETVTEQEPSIADLLRAKIDERQQRLAEGATKNADGTTTYGGKVHRKRNWKDALKSAGLGMLQSLASAPPTNDLGSLLGRAIGGAGAGGVMGATMNNVDERMVDKMKLAQLVPQYNQAYGMERQKKADETAIANAESLRKDREVDNKRNAADLKRKIEKDAATTAYWNRKADQGDLKIANDVELMALRDKWAESKNVIDKRRLDLVEKEMLERTKRNQANIESREKIAGMSSATQTRLAELRVAATTALREMEEAGRNNRASEAQAARERLAKIKAEKDSLDGGLQTGSTPIP